VTGEGQPYLLILGHREGLSWVLKNSRMAFTASRASEGERLAIGDRLFLYTTRGCFGNPTRDRGRVIGEAEVVGRLRRRPTPLSIGGRNFTHDCRIALASLAQFRKGIVIAELVPKLEVFPDERSWSARLRRPLLPLTPNDAQLIASQLRRMARPVGETVNEYITRVTEAERRRPQASRAELPHSIRTTA
jgi:hypothetical protein